MFDTASGKAPAAVAPSSGPLWDSLTVLYGREQVAAASQAGDVVLWNWRSGNVAHAWKMGDKPIQRMAYSPAANRLALVAYDREDVVMIDANTGDEVDTVAAPSCTDCAFSPDGRRLAVDTLNNLLIYDLESRRQICLAPDIRARSTTSPITLAASSSPPPAATAPSGCGLPTASRWPNSPGISPR